MADRRLKIELTEFVAFIRENLLFNAHITKRKIKQFNRKVSSFRIVEYSYVHDRIKKNAFACKDKTIVLRIQRTKSAYYKLVLEFENYINDGIKEFLRVFVELLNC